MTKILAFNRARRGTRVNNEGKHLDNESRAIRRGSGSPTPLSSVDNNNSKAGPTVSEPTVSVVIPTRGRPQLLNRCIASLVLQRFDPDRFEIIVVDDGAGVDSPGVDTSCGARPGVGTPGCATRDIVNGWAAHTADRGPLITYIPSMGPHGPAAARNHGWRAARAPIIAFTDDDTIARSDWLANGVQAFADGVHVVCGRIVMPLNGTPTDYELDAKHLETAEFVTANCFCRKQVLEDLGGFDERFRFAWREDSDLHFRLLEYRANIQREPKAVIVHPVRPASWGVSLSQVKKVQFDALLFKKHPRLYRHRIRATPRWDFYLTVAALLACIAALAVQASGIALMAGLVWLFMTGRFCFRRLKDTSKSPRHIAEMIVTSALIPPLAVFWRAVGALKFRVGFL